MVAIFIYGMCAGYLLHMIQQVSRKVQKGNRLYISNARRIKKKKGW